MGQSLLAARAEILNVALETAPANGDYALAARVFLPLVAEIPVQREYVWFAEAAGRALYAAGRFERAAAWFTLARQESLLSPEAAGAVARLWPYTRLAALASGTWEGNLIAWTDAQAGTPEDDFAKRRLLLRAAFQALGESDSLAWVELIGTAPPELSERPAPDAALIRAMSEASEIGRLGETVLLALLALGEAGPGASHPLVLYEGWKKEKVPRNESAISEPALLDFAMRASAIAEFLLTAFLGLRHEPGIGTEVTLEIPQQGVREARRER